MSEEKLTDEEMAEFTSAGVEALSEAMADWLQEGQPSEETDETDEVDWEKVVTVISDCLAEMIHEAALEAQADADRFTDRATTAVARAHLADRLDRLILPGWIADFIAWRVWPKPFLPPVEVHVIQDITVLGKPVVVELEDGEVADRSH